MRNKFIRITQKHKVTHPTLGVSPLFILKLKRWTIRYITPFCQQGLVKFRICRKRGWAVLKRNALSIAFALGEPIMSLDEDNATFKVPLSMTGSVRLPLNKDYCGYPFFYFRKRGLDTSPGKTTGATQHFKKDCIFYDRHSLFD